MRVSMVYWAFTLAMWTFTIYLFSRFMKCGREKNFNQLLRITKMQANRDGDTLAWPDF